MPKRRSSVKPEDFMTFGELLHFLRKRAHLSQQQLAAMAGYHYTYISYMESNARLPDEATLLARFVPALEIEDEPEWVARLIQLASGKQRVKGESKPEETASQTEVYRVPSSLTSMLGREKEITSLTELICRPEVRLLTIVGPPGVGKTRLALHIAETLAGSFTQGAIFVNLAPVEQANLVTSALAEALGVKETSIVSSMAAVQSVLQKKNLLIVMDNFEQVLSAAPEVSQLLQYAPGLKVIVTSREALRIQGEHEFQLAPLSVPDEKQADSIQDLDNSPAVQLFIQRARAVRPNFQLTNDNASRLAEICRRLDGLPLAIELAAARIGTLSLTAMLEQFDRRFDWLTRGQRDTVAWRRTLLGAIEWSHALLPEPGRILLRRLAVFSGGWTLESAEEVCSDDSALPRADILYLLLQLADHSLVISDLNENRTRYRFLDTIRHFAHKELEQANELTELHNRHLAHYAGWAENSENLLNTVSPLELRAITESEHNNLRAALDWGLNERANPDDAFRLMMSVGTIWLKHSHFKEALEWIERYLPLVGKRELVHARLLYLGQALSYWRDNLSRARSYGMSAELIARKVGDRKVLANILYYSGDVYREGGDLSKARSCLEESITICREVGHTHRLTMGLTSLSIVLYQQGERTLASTTLDEALQISADEHYLWGQSYALRVQADSLRFDGRYSEALTAFQRALEVCVAIDDRISAGMAWANLSLVANMLGDYEASGEYARSAFTIFQMIGNEYQQPFPLRMMAYAALKMGDLSGARAFCKDSLRGNQNINHQTGILASLVAWTEIELADNNLERAAELYSLLEKEFHKVAPLEPDLEAFKRITDTLQNIPKLRLNKPKVLSLKDAIEVVENIGTDSLPIL